jgi:butyryl-CoA dehydrogenase
MIIAHEWYRQYFEEKAAGPVRDYENDAAEADAPEEKIYE